MKSCDICGVEQYQTGEFYIEMSDIVTEENIASFDKIPKYNIRFVAHLKGKNICDKCMKIHHEVDKLISGF